MALVRTPGVGPVTIRQLISYCSGAENIYRADFKKLIKIPGISEKTARAILKKDEWVEAEKEWERSQKAGVKLIFYTGSNLP